MICPKCGKELDESEKFCDACGEKLGVTDESAEKSADNSIDNKNDAVTASQEVFVAQNNEAPASDNSEIPAKQKKSKTGIIIAVIAIVAVIAAALIIIIPKLCCGSSASDVIIGAFERLSESKNFTMSANINISGASVGADMTVDMDKSEKKLNFKTNLLGQDIMFYEGYLIISQNGEIISANDSSEKFTENLETFDRDELDAETLQNLVTGLIELTGNNAEEINDIIDFDKLVLAAEKLKNDLGSDDYLKDNYAYALSSEGSNETYAFTVNVYDTVNRILERTRNSFKDAEDFDRYMDLLSQNIAQYKDVNILIAFQINDGALSNASITVPAELSSLILESSIAVDISLSFDEIGTTEFDTASADALKEKAIELLGDSDSYSSYQNSYQSGFGEESAS